MSPTGSGADSPDRDRLRNSGISSSGRRLTVSANKDSLAVSPDLGSALTEVNCAPQGITNTGLKSVAYLGAVAMTRVWVFCLFVCFFVSKKPF